MHFGSRKREITPGDDNFGFATWASNQLCLYRFFEVNPAMRLYGEWLVPHTLKDYEDDAWRKFYVFDVCASLPSGGLKYFDYTLYAPVLEAFGLESIPPLGYLNPGDDPSKFLDASTFLVKDQAPGEGIVIKNYEFVNKYGHKTWAKIVRDEFKARTGRVKGPKPAPIDAEPAIIYQYLTEAAIKKVYAKMTAGEEWEQKRIPELLSRVFYDLVSEEAYNFVSKLKMPTVNFKTLRRLSCDKVREVLPELF